jgi:hypothetical protein
MSLFYQVGGDVLEECVSAAVKFSLALINSRMSAMRAYCSGPLPRESKSAISSLYRNTFVRLISVACDACAGVDTSCASVGRPVSAG